MVHLTAQNDFIVLEGDEYLSSPIDRRPKFHLYKPNIALLSGIAWDHINVFPTFENYVEQFRIFVDGIVKGGSITYNIEDEEVKKVVEASENAIRKLPYSTPEYSVENGQTLLETPEGPMPIGLFPLLGLYTTATIEKLSPTSSDLLLNINSIRVFF